MKTHLLYLLLICAVTIAASCSGGTGENKYVTYTTTPSKLKMWMRNDAGRNIDSISGLIRYVELRGETLRFATNGGMYEPDGSPVGLYIEKGRQLSPLNTSAGKGNFYLQPNGVFYITTNNKAGIRPTKTFSESNIKYATQSGPMLVIDGRLHPAFTEGSSNLQIRNGVGILPDGKILFAMSKEPVSLYDFANFFRNNSCKNAVYLDGFVSRTYLPADNWIQTDGNFGVIIGVTEKEQ